MTDSSSPQAPPSNRMPHPNTILEWSRNIDVLPRSHLGTQGHPLTVPPISEWDVSSHGICSKIGYLADIFDNHNTKNLYQLGSIVMRYLPPAKDRLGHMIPDGILIQFSRQCDAFDVKMILNAVKHLNEFETLPSETTVHVNGGTHGRQDGSNVFAFTESKLNYQEVKFTMEDFESIKVHEVLASYKPMDQYTPPLYCGARISINAWCYSDNGFYGGTRISWGHGLPRSWTMQIFGSPHRNNDQASSVGYEPKVITKSEDLECYFQNWTASRETRLNIMESSGASDLSRQEEEEVQPAHGHGHGRDCDDHNFIPGENYTSREGEGEVDPFDTFDEHLYDVKARSIGVCSFCRRGKEAVFCCTCEQCMRDTINKGKTLCIERCYCEACGKCATGGSKCLHCSDDNPRVTLEQDDAADDAPVAISAASILKHAIDEEILLELKVNTATECEMGLLPLTKGMKLKVISNKEVGIAYHTSGNGFIDNFTLHLNRNEIDWSAALQSLLSSRNLRLQDDISNPDMSSAGAEAAHQPPMYDSRQEAENIVVIGATGVGKTACVKLLINFSYLCALEEESFHPKNLDKLRANLRQINTIAEADRGDQTKSQTQASTFYEDVCIGNQRYTLIDTPGIGDTAGIDKDNSHIQNIIQSVSSVDHVKALLFIMNGTNPRLGTGIEYIISKISTILPKDILGNIFLIFTMQKKRHLINFRTASLQDNFNIEIKREICLDNPFVELERAELALENGMTEEFMMNALYDGFKEADKVIKEMFCEVKQTKQVHSHKFLDVYNTKKNIEERLLKLRADSMGLEEKKKKIQEAKDNFEKATDQQKCYQKYSQTQIVMKWIPVKTERHNTICKDCNSNCHLGCYLTKTIDPGPFFMTCSAFSYEPICQVEGCGHGYDVHYHSNLKWTKKPISEKVINEDMKRQYEVASNDTQRKKVAVQHLEQQLLAVEQQAILNANLVCDVLQEYKEKALPSSYVKALRREEEYMKKRIYDAEESNCDSTALKNALNTLQHEIFLMAEVEEEEIRKSQKKKQKGFSWQTLVRGGINRGVNLGNYMIGCVPVHPNENN